ncbi:MAG: hypothetical protein KA248_02380 [Kiritimatiellae bacterium]|nr:hypothetical protein [Kiritimatiellia bacterium]
MSSRSKLERLILAVNTLGLTVYLFWLAFGGRRIMRTQDGVLYLLPVMPMLFVYAFLLQRRKTTNHASE